MGHVLFAYVDGSDLQDVADDLVGQLDRFVSANDWPRATWVVNQRHPPDPEFPNDLPDWDLGINHSLPDPGVDAPGWFEPVAVIARFLGTLSQRTRRQFVIGFANSATGVAEDVAYVDGPDCDIESLRLALGDTPPDST